MLDDLHSLLDGELDDLEAPMHPASMEGCPTLGADLDRMTHLHIHPLHTVPPMIVPPISPPTGARLPLLLGPLARPWRRLVGGRTLAPAQLGVLLLQVSYPLPQVGILLG
jgi:anti-sigma factor RsiW